MNKVARKYLKFGMLTITFIMVAQLAIPLVAGVIDSDRPRTIQPGYGRAYIYTVRNYKNQKITITTFFNETVPSYYDLHVFCTREEEWLDISDGEASVFDMQQNASFHVVDHGERYVLEYIVPDWEDWTFVFLNLNPADMLTQIRIEHQHVLWWLWIVIPSVVIIGLVVYGVVETTTKYERAKMNNDKAMDKMESRSDSERQRATYYLQSNGGKEEIPLLKEKLLDTRPAIRENAAKALGGISRRIGDKSSSVDLLKAYDVESDGLCKEAIVGALCDIGDVNALPIYEKYIEFDHNEKLRFRIAETLAEIASEKSSKILVKIMQGENTDTLKIAANRALEKIAAKASTSVDKLMTKYSS
ncbi:MAG: hypothetical protein FK733_01585 [Asgard group archaeon]|nr:hypothetical protein [Asgard group archaeon]